jgi:hypothetical protein
VKFQEWLLDCQLYRISILQAKEAYLLLDNFLTSLPAEQVFKVRSKTTLEAAAAS